jgi:hypothetical protein
MSKKQHYKLAMRFLSGMFWALWLGTAGIAGLIAAYAVNCEPTAIVVWLLYVSWLFKEGYEDLEKSI